MNVCLFFLFFLLFILGRDDYNDHDDDYYYQKPDENAYSERLRAEMADGALVCRARGDGAGRRRAVGVYVVGPEGDDS